VEIELGYCELGVEYIIYYLDEDLGLTIYYLDEGLRVEYIMYYLDEELGVEYIIYYLDEFHIGSILVGEGTFFCKCCVFACQYRSTNALRYIIIKMTKRSKPQEPSDKEMPCRTLTFHADPRVYVAAHQFPGALCKQI
jgi:hypothetical protein